MENGERVAFVEADPQGTISKWKERRENPYPRVDRVADPAELERALLRLEAEGIWLAIIVCFSPIVLKNSKMAGLRKSRKCSALAVSAAARLCRIDASASDRFCGN
jgi:hypothetical protein